MGPCLQILLIPALLCAGASAAPDAPDPEEWRASYRTVASYVSLNQALQAAAPKQGRLQVSTELNLPRVTLCLARPDSQRLEALVRELLALPEGELLRNRRSDGSILIESDLHRRAYVKRLHDGELEPLRRAILAAAAAARGGPELGEDGKPLFHGQAAAPNVLARLSGSQIEALLKGIPQILAAPGAGPGAVLGGGDVNVLALSTWPDGVRTPTISINHFSNSGLGRSGGGNFIRPAGDSLRMLENQIASPGGAVDLDALLRARTGQAEEEAMVTLRLPGRREGVAVSEEPDRYGAISPAELLARVAAASGHDLLAATPLQAPLFYRLAGGASRVSLEVLLDRLALHYGWRWRVVPGDRPAIVVTSLRWWRSKETEPTDTQLAWAIRRLREKPADEPPTMADLASVAKMDRGQIQRLEQAHLLPWSSGLIDDLFSDGREALPLVRFFIALPPEQRQQALSPAGLPLRDAPLAAVKEHLEHTVRLELAMPAAEQALDAVFRVAAFEDNVRRGWLITLKHPVARNRSAYGHLNAPKGARGGAKQIDRGLPVAVFVKDEGKRRLQGLGGRHFHRRDVEWLERRGRPEQEEAAAVRTPGHPAPNGQEASTKR